MLRWTQSPVLVRIRFAMSLVLAFFAVTHFLNHALGLVSLEAMEAGRKIFLAFWRNTVVQFVFPLALFLHAQSAIWRLMFRQGWSFTTREKIKIGSGLLIPFFLLLHIAGTRLHWWVNGYNDTYAYYLYHNFRGAGFYFLITMALLIWVHAWYGLSDILMLRAWFNRHRTTFAVIFAAIPLIGAAGLISAAGQVARLAEDPQWLARVNQEHGGFPALTAEMQLLFYFILIALFLLLILTLLLARRLVLRKAVRRANIRVAYADGPEVSTTGGTTLLEVSLANNIEHAHVCGGSGRCSTCRVRIVSGGENISAATRAETAILKKIAAEKDIRLACQARVSGNVRIAPLIAPSQARDAGAAALLAGRAAANGSEREVVVFFSDLKGFTSFSENKLPYDVVFVLNQYFRSMGKIIEQHNGFIDKFIGDGIMAIFGLNEELPQAARHALDASLQMREQLLLINEFLAEEIAQPLEIRIGLHAGHAIIGDMGYGQATHMTAIGDVVNTASRLEHANKKLNTWLLFSGAVAGLAGITNLPQDWRARIQLRGKSDFLEIYGVPKEKTFTPEYGS